MYDRCSVPCSGNKKGIYKKRCFFSKPSDGKHKSLRLILVYIYIFNCIAYLNTDLVYVLVFFKAYMYVQQVFCTVSWK